MRLRLAAVLLLALGLRSVFFTGMTSSDDVFYHRAARLIADGTYSSFRRPDPDPKFYRFGLLLPLVALRALFPPPIAGAMLTLAGSLASIFFVILVGRRLLSDTAGLVAGILMALSPLDIQMATSLFPETIVTAVMLGAMLLVMRGTPGAMLAAGLLSGIGMTMKENAFFWFPFFAWWCWQARTRVRSWIWGPVGFFGFMTALVLFYAIKTGNPLFQYEAIDKSYSTEATDMYYTTSGRIVRRLFLDLPEILLSPMHPLAPAFGLFGCLAVIAAIAVRRDPGMKPVLIMAGTLLFCFNFVPARIYPYAPGIILHRYLQPLLVPAVLIIGAAVAARRRLVWAALFVIPLEMSCAWILTVDAEDLNAGARNAARTLRGSPVTVWSEQRTAETLLYYWGIRSNVRETPLHYPVAEGDPEPVEGDLVYVNMQTLLRDSRWWKSELPWHVVRPPVHWRPIGTFVPSYRGSLRSGAWRRSERPDETCILYRVGKR